MKSIVLSLITFIVGFANTSFAQGSRLSQAQLKAIAIEHFDTDNIKCEAVQTFNIANYGILKVRYMYHEVRTIYNWYRPYKTLETFAYEASANGQITRGVLDFYSGDATHPLTVEEAGKYLLISHKYGTHMIPYDNLFIGYDVTHDATKYYPGWIPCRDEMP